MTAKLKEPLSTAVDQVRESRQRLTVRRNGKIVAAIVPADDLAILEELEEMDRRDLQAHRRAMARAKKRGEKPIPVEEVGRKLGLAAPNGRGTHRGGGRSDSR